MTDTTPITAGAKGTVYFSRKVQPRDYEAAEAGIYVQFDVPPEATNSDLMAAANDAFYTAKGLVLEQLGLEFSVNEGGVIMETIHRHFGATQNVAAAPQQQAAPPPPAAAPAATAPPSGARTCAGCGGTNFYDNSEKKASGEYKANAPDFKCSDKNCGKGVWLKPKGR